MSKVLIFFTLALFMATLAFECNAALFFYHANPQVSPKPISVSFRSCFTFNVNDFFLTQEENNLQDEMMKNENDMSRHKCRRNYLPNNLWKNLCFPSIWFGY